MFRRDLPATMSCESETLGLLRSPSRRKAAPTGMSQAFGSDVSHLHRSFGVYRVYERYAVPVGAVLYREGPQRGPNNLPCEAEILGLLRTSASLPHQRL